MPFQERPSLGIRGCGWIGVDEGFLDDSCGDAVAALGLELGRDILHPFFVVAVCEYNSVGIIRVVTRHRLDVERRGMGRSWVVERCGRIFRPGLDDDEGNLGDDRRRSDDRMVQGDW